MGRSFIKYGEVNESNTITRERLRVAHDTLTILRERIVVLKDTIEIQSEATEILQTHMGTLRKELTKETHRTFVFRPMLWFRKRKL